MVKKSDVLFCEECDDFVEYSIIEKEEAREVMGNEKISINSKIAVCNNCNNELFHEKLEEENQRKAFDIYRDRNNILYPEEIKEIREKYNLTQKQMSKLLGWGSVTYHRYEKGSLPDKAHNSQLKLIKDPACVNKLLEEGNTDLEEETVNELKGKIKKLMEENNQKVEMNIPGEFYNEIKSEAEKHGMEVNEYLIYLITRYHFTENMEKEKKNAQQDAIENMFNIPTIFKENK